MLVIHIKTVFVIALLYINKVPALRPPELVRDTYCGECPEQKNSSSSERECYKVQGSKETHWCCKCGPGTYPSKPCTDTKPTTTECTKCPSGTYTSEYNNETECFISRLRQSCNILPNTEFLSGNASMNNKCVCVHGTYSKDPEKAGCKPHWECPKGFGVLTPGNSSNDVECEPCKDGYCSSIKSSVEKCKPCSDVESLNVTSPTDATATSECTTPTPRNKTSPNCETVQCADNTGYIIAIVFLSLVLVIIAARLGCHYCKKRTGKPDGQRSGDAVENGTAGIQQPSHVDVQGSRTQKKKARHRSQAQDASKAKSYEMEPLIVSERNKTQNRAQPENQSAHKAIEKTMSKSDDGSQPMEVGHKIYNEPQADDKATPPPPERDLKSKKTLTPDQYTRIFREKKYEIVHDPDGNGHCQFNAIAWFLNFYKVGMEEWCAEILRQIVVRHIQSNRQDYEGFIDEDFNYYLKEMKKGKYGDGITLRAAERIFKKEIIVITTSNGPEPNTRTSEQAILLGHIDEDQGMHYVCLKALNSSNASSSTPSSDNQVEDSGDPTNQQTSSQRENGQSSRRPEQNGMQSEATEHGMSDMSQQRLHSASSDNYRETQLAAAQPEINLVQEIMNACQRDQTFETDNNALPQSIEDMLEKSEIGHKMVGALQDHTHDSVKSYLRYIEFLTEVEIDDIEKDNSNNVKEMRYQWIQKAKAKHGRKLTPRHLLNLKYPEAIFRDKMIAVFVQELKNVLPSSPQAH